MLMLLLSVCWTIRSISLLTLWLYHLRKVLTGQMCFLLFCSCPKTSVHGAFFFLGFVAEVYYNEETLCMFIFFREGHFVPHVRLA